MKTITYLGTITARGPQLLEDLQLELFVLENAEDAGVVEVEIATDERRNVRVSLEHI